MKTEYEWDIETVDISMGPVESPDVDIIEHRHSATCPTVAIRPDQRLVLVRDVWCNVDGLIDRQWAYVIGRGLPEYFSSTVGKTGTRVPKRFHDELKRCQKLKTT